jgi:SWIM zinc finger
MPHVTGAMRWSVDQVLALAPDASAQRAARALATLRPWRETGCAGTAAGGGAPVADPPLVWGLCKGSGTEPYRTAVDCAEPAYRCSCPSRKLPCKHALALLLLWAQGAVAPGAPPGWVSEWRAARQARAARRAGPDGAGASRAPTSARTRARRAERVAGGLDELDRWLADQVRHGLAGAGRTGYTHWDAMAARLVDAQAPGAAGAVRRLAGAATDPTGERLLTELSLLRLLVSAYRRLDGLPADLAATVRARVGLPVPTEEVLAGPRVGDEWYVLGVRDQVDERLTTRRAWLRGAGTGRPALVLSFAAPGQTLPADPVVGTVLDADLCFFPGAQPLRALVADRRAVAVRAQPPPADAVPAALRGYARALAGDPWLDRWPMVLGAVTPCRWDGARGGADGPDGPAGRLPGGTPGSWVLRDAAGDALPVDPAAGEPWRLVAAAGGQPCTVAGEWTPAGLRPLTAWAGATTAGGARLVRVDGGVIA